jgi:hypothetical protein
MKTFREIAEMHYIAEANNEVDKQYRLNRIDALEKLLIEECEEKIREKLIEYDKWVHEGGCTHLNGFTYEYVVIREIDVTSEEIENAIIDFV